MSRDKNGEIGGGDGTGRSDGNRSVAMSTGGRHILRVQRKKNRLIVYTDSIAKSDVYTFESAAKSLREIYQRRYRKDSDRITVRKAYSGKEIVEFINKQERSSIVSLDIVSHGNPAGVHIARKLTRPQKAGLIQREVHALIRANVGRPQTWEDAEYIEESMHGLYSGLATQEMVAKYYNQTCEPLIEGGNRRAEPDTAFLDAIQADRFAPETFVELHGCSMAVEKAPWSTLLDNFAENLSRLLPDSAITIGHIKQSAAKTIGKVLNDYRHGSVRVYQGGGMFADSVERSTQRFKNSSTPP